MRIILTGAQGTGKTTVLNRLTEYLPECKVITGVVRDLASQGIKINQSGDEEGQRTIFNLYADILTGDDSYISDRGLTDVAAYTLYLQIRDKVGHRELCRESEILKILSNIDILWVYFPIEFPVIADGVRSTDEEYRKEIDGNIQSFLKMYNINHITVHGSVDERVMQIMDAVKNHEK